DRGTGSYSLTGGDGRGGMVRFRVEEYKRPGFDVRMDTVSDKFSLGQEVGATGGAMPFSGGSMGKAKVTYRIVRHQVYPYARWNFRRHVSPAEVAAGETMTNDEGIFHILFTATPGEKATAGEFRFCRYDM